MIEIKDDILIDQIEKTLNFGFKDSEDTSPVIVGTVVNCKNKGFSRKLRMLRADIFTFLSVCSSRKYVSSRKEVSALKNGLF